MPIDEHPCFDRPTVTSLLWRYMDLPKLISLLTTRQLWLTNAEVLAADDPHEGTLSPLQFPHRVWKSIDDIPPNFRQKILKHYADRVDGSPDAAFRGFVRIQEQQCLFTQFWRRQYYVNCWHEAQHESVAMWKIYGAPGTGVAIVSNGARLEQSLSVNEHKLYLGRVRYVDHDAVQIGMGNGFESIMGKRKAFSYENEVRLVYWDTSDSHDPLVHDQWNDETMRFDNIVDDPRPVTPGIGLECDIDTMIEALIVSPLAPPWYASMIEALRQKLGYKFPIVASNLLSAPVVIQ